MSDCCDRTGYQTVFSDRFARRVARMYCRRGLDRTQRRLVTFLTERGIEHASVLEIGGGVGEIQIELLSRGARKATNLEISRNYEREAEALLERFGMVDRVQRRFVDIATSPNAVEPADVVVLHRVVCCYPDYERLLSAAAGHAKRLLVYSHPPRNSLIRMIISCENLLHRLRGSDFRAFVHPPAAMIKTAEAQGMSVSYRHRGVLWRVVGLER
ncbi:MAG TPA: methyltransferase domain-containing protein [Propionibacteriaceae bacterium]|nr:methyltransferase domain-containing protein [Propionibacteriaceae bacterium]